MRWIIRTILVIALVAVIGLTALFAIPTDAITQRVVDRLSEQTGRNVEIRGRVRPQLFPSLGIRAEEIEIGNPDWVDEGPMLVAQALEVGVAWGPLFRGDIHLSTGTLSAPRLVLVRGAEGRLSWASAPDPGSGTVASEPVADPQSDGGAAAGLPGFAFDEISIEDAAVLFVDHQAGRTLAFDPVRANLSADAEGRAARLSLSIQEIALTLEIEDLAALQSGIAAQIGMALDWPGGEAAYAGSVSLAPSVAGVLTLEAETLAPLFALGGMAAPALPQGLGRSQVAFQGDIALTEAGDLQLRNGAATLDGNPVSMSLDLLPGAARPMLRGSIQAGDLRFSDAASIGTGPASANSAPQSEVSSNTATGWSQTPIDASGLFALDADLSVTTEQLTLGPLVLDRTQMRLINDNGRLAASVSDARLFGGTMTGDLVANARNTFSARGDFALTDIQLGPALSALADYDRLRGTGSVALSLVAQGASQAELMRDLDGSGSISLGPGALEGLDIAGMLRNLDLNFRGEGARTVYDSVAATFTVTQGVLDNDDLAMAAPWGGIRGSGSVDIGARTLDYLVVPGLSARDDGTSRVNVPIRATGSWEDPRFRPDLEALAEEQFSDEIDALEDAATEAARDLVRDELGLEIEEGTSRDDAIDQVEDAIGERLEEELLDGLRGLFD
ncbi:MAG: AsmA family protein [Pseudomonadota bacterium]